ncbi:MAG: tetratricopeptide repeat protein [Blastocatellia bacterium]
MAQQVEGQKKSSAKVKPEDKEQVKQAETLFESGQAAHQTGDLEKAIGLYTEAIKLDPEMWQAELQRGIVLTSLNKLVEAKDSMARVIDQLRQFSDSNDLRQISSRVQITLGQIAAAENKAVEAEKAFRRALELNQQAARAHTGLAEILLKAGKTDEAVAEAKAAIANGDDSDTAYSLLGVAQTQSGKYDDALLVLGEALKRDPKNVLTHRHRAEALIAKNRLSEAIVDLRSAIAIEPHSQTKLRLAGVYIQAKQYNEAISVYQEVLKADPANVEARTALAAVMVESGKSSEAIAQLESLIKVDPNRADMRAQLAELYLPTQPEKALEQYSAASKLDPSQPGHQIGMASAFVKLRRFQEAVALLLKVIAQNPKDELAYYAHTNLAVALFELDDFQNAAREFIRILDYQRNRGDQKRAAVTLYFLGICFDKLGDFEQALKAYEQFLAMASAENQLEIDKVKLRLPSLQRQIKEGKGRRKQ